jgi:hypothetical protein
MVIFFIEMVIWVLIKYVNVEEFDAWWVGYEVFLEQAKDVYSWDWHPQHVCEPHRAWSAELIGRHRKEVYTFANQFPMDFGSWNPFDPISFTSIFYLTYLAKTVYKVDLLCHNLAICWIKGLMLRGQIDILGSFLQPLAWVVLRENESKEQTYSFPGRRIYWPNYIPIE